MRFSELALDHGSFLMMIDYRLCNVLFSEGQRSSDYPELYFRFSKPINTHENDTANLSSPSFGKYDFSTYFNAFSNEKWKEYTSIDSVWLRIVARGSFLVEYTSYEATQAAPKRTVLHTQQHDFEQYQTIDYCFPATNATLLSFAITTYSQVDVKEAYYFTKIDEDLLNPVELAVATTTYQKEDFVIPNIKLLTQEILQCSEPIAQHFTLHIIDNGRTLDAKALTQGRVIVHPNPNVGGSGGFARGMIEAIEQTPKATHVVLMDDDVQVSPESLKRTYALLSLVNEEYSSALISGAMLSFEKQNEFNEDVGFVRENGVYGPTKPHVNVSKLESIVALEAVRSHRQNCYAGWWYCCIPVSMIEEKGLPLPVFIRGDDAEYGNRCGSKFMTMNGICIWHLTFAYKFRAAFERYQFPRNSLIAQATTGVYPNVNFMEECHRNILLDLKTFNYDGAEMGLKALEDFLRGPEFIKQVHGDELMKELSAKNDKLSRLDEIPGIQFDELNFDPKSLYLIQDRSIFQRAFDYLTINGQRFTPSFFLKREVGLMPYDGWYYGPNNIRRHSEILAISGDGKEGILRKMDKRRCVALYHRYKKLMRECRNQGKEVRTQYAAARDELTSMSFWKKYLGID